MVFSKTQCRELISRKCQIFTVIKQQTGTRLSASTSTWWTLQAAVISHSFRCKSFHYTHNIWLVFIAVVSWVLRGYAIKCGIICMKYALFTLIHVHSLTVYAVWLKTTETKIRVALWAHMAQERNLHSFICPLPSPPPKNSSPNPTLKLCLSWYPFCSTQ